VASTFLEFTSFKERNRFGFHKAFYWELRNLRQEAAKGLRLLFKGMTFKVCSAVLPGIVSSLSKTVSGDYKQGHGIIVSGRKCCLILR
jgi:hypothetical protein